jgi:hypothetical protein
MRWLRQKVRLVPLVDMNKQRPERLQINFAERFSLGVPQAARVVRASIGDVALLLEVFFAIDLSASVTLFQGLKGRGTPL